MSLAVEPPVHPAEIAPPLQLRLLRGFELRQLDHPTEVPTNVQRLVAFLALSGCPQHRIKIAGTLWADRPDERAAANLRTALWRARRIDEGLVTTRAGYLALGPEVRIDLTDAVDRAKRVVADPDHCDPDQAPAVFVVDDLLPEWYDDWIIFERERLRQLLLHSLEILSLRLSALGRHALAIEAGLAAVAAEPLRESAQRVLIAAHLDEGNMAEAVRQYDRFARLLDDALGIAPSETLRALVAPCR
jgi:DNA-binding SARP family transcriptional activator